VTGRDGSTCRGKNRKKGEDECVGISFSRRGGKRAGTIGPRGGFSLEPKGGKNKIDLGGHVRRGEKKRKKRGSLAISAISKKGGSRDCPEIRRYWKESADIGHRAKRLG